MLGIVCDGLASHPGGSSNTPSHFMLGIVCDGLASHPEVVLPHSPIHFIMLSSLGSLRSPRDQNRQLRRLYAGRPVINYSGEGKY